MNQLMERIKNEPVLIIGLVTTIIDLAIATGVDLDEPVKVGIIGVVTAVMGLFARSQVTPARNVVHKTTY